MLTAHCTHDAEAFQLLTAHCTHDAEAFQLREDRISHTIPEPRHQIRRRKTKGADGVERRHSTRTATANATPPSVVSGSRSIATCDDMYATSSWTFIDKDSLLEPLTVMPALFYRYEDRRSIWGLLPQRPKIGTVGLEIVRDEDDSRAGGSDKDAVRMVV